MKESGFLRFYAHLRAMVGLVGGDADVIDDDTTAVCGFGFVFDFDF